LTGATGAVRATVPLRFPTETVKASTVLPDLHKYKGPALEYGRMEMTASDPRVQQQFGMITGKPNAGQVNALATLNIRGERSVTCRGDFDRHPAEGPLPAGAPLMCDGFRRLPDALERAAELDAMYGRNPDLVKMPMYGVVFSFKDPFDTKDMRPGNLRLETFYGPNAGLTEVLIPAGYVTIVYDPVFALTMDGTRYMPVPSDTPTTIPEPGLPFSLVFRAEPGREDVLLKIASAYEAASRRRVPPPAFGPLPARGVAPR